MVKESISELKAETMGWEDPYKVPIKVADYKSRMEYALSYFRKKQAEFDKISMLKRKFIGNEVQDDMEYIRQTYVRHYRVQYHDYRIGYRVIMQMVGEWLRRPINSTVYAVNSSAMYETEEAANVHVGLHYVRNEVSEMRQKGHGDPFDGMESAYDGENIQNLLSKLNDKQTRVMTMQLLLNNFIKTGAGRDLLFANYIDTLLASSCFSEVSLGPSGNMQARPVDNRRIAFVEIEGDVYCEQTPFIIEERPMTYGDILETYPELKEKGREEDLLKVKSYFGSNGNMASNMPTGYGEVINDNNLLKVYRLQFKIYLPRAQKREKDHVTGKLKNVADYSPETYIKNKYKIESGAKLGQYELSVKYRKTTYQCTQIGPDVFVGCGRVPNQIVNPDDPLYASYNYAGLLFNTVMGKRTSIQELIIHLDREYNVGRMMLNREIAKFKGSVMAYNRAFLPRNTDGTPVGREEILTTAINDGILDINTSADGNYAGENVDPGNLLKNIDWGMSKSLDMLINILYDLENTMYKIVGFNQERLGETPASSTVTNATNNLINSQASTSPLDYFFDRYIDKLAHKIIENEKISLAFYQKNKGNILLGPDLMAPIRADKNFADDFYGVYTADSRRDDAARQRMSIRGEQAISQNQVRTQDLMKAEIAETIQEAAAILDASWEKMQEIAQQAAKEQQASNERMNQANLQAMAEKDMRDKQHEIGKIIVEGSMQKAQSAEQGMMDYAKVMQQGENKKQEQAQKADLEL